MKGAWPKIFLVVLVGLFIGALSWYTITAFHKTNINRFDLGNIEQLIWNTVHGHGFRLTDPYGTATVSRFAFHIDPLLLVFVPFYALYQHAETLIIIQILFLASGIVAAWLLGKRWLQSSFAAAVAAIVYAFSAPVLWAAIEPIHAVSLAAPLILWMVLAAEQKKWWLMLGLAALILASKEQAGIVIALFGGWLIVFRRQKKWGTVLMIAGIAWSLICFFLLLPHFRPQASSDAEVYRSAFGTNASDVVRGVVTHPISAVRTVLGGESRRYIVQLVATTGGLALLNPISVMALPDMVVNGLSTKPQQHQIMFHYHGTLWPWLFVSMLLSWMWLLRWVPLRWRPTVAIVIPTWLIVTTAVCAWQFSPLPGAKLDRLRFATWKNEYALLVTTLTKTIPSDAPIAVTNNIGAQFARRENLFLFPRGIHTANYAIILERHAPGVIATDADIAAAREELAQDPAWRLIQQTGDLSVWQRQLYE